MFNPFELQNKTLERTDISLGAKVIMIRLRNAAGRKGKIQLRVSKICEWLGIDKKQKRMIQYYISELILVGLVKREVVRGHANYWIVTDVYGKYLTHAKDCTTVKDSFQKRTNVCRNVIFSQSKPKETYSPNIHYNFQQKPFNLTLVNRIIKSTGDKKSTNYWIMIVRKLPESEILEYLSHLKIAMNEKIINHPGAYLNSLVLANHPEFRRSSTIIQSQSQQKKYVESEEPEGTPASEEVAKMAIAEIMAKLNRKVG
jgi:hypothetical protein